MFTLHYVLQLGLDRIFRQPCVCIDVKLKLFAHNDELDFEYALVHYKCFKSMYVHTSKTSFVGKWL